MVEQVCSVIFLDIDGVITSRRVHVAYGDDGPWSRPDPVAVAFLNRLVADACATVVISSSWRKEESREFILNMLVQAGFTGELHDDWATPDIGHRGDEVADWLSRHLEVVRWVALDDDASGFRRRQQVVTTSLEEGFLLEHYRRARVLLGLGETVPAAVEAVDLERTVRAAAEAARKGRFKEAARLAIAAEQLLS